MVTCKTLLTPLFTNHNFKRGKEYNVAAVGWSAETNGYFYEVIGEQGPVLVGTNRDLNPGSLWAKRTIPCAVKEKILEVW